MNSLTHLAGVSSPAIMGALVPKLPITSGTPPKKWPGERFDAVLRFDRPAGTVSFAYRMLLPQLLGGDAAGGF